jgi:outer membrane protein assembly factor BamB
MSVPFFAKANGDWIRATPACDGKSLYVAGIRDVLVCLAADTGRQRWRVDFMAELKSVLPAFGFASSPMIHGNSVYVQAGGGFCRLDKETGKLIWRTLDDGGGLWSSAFSSPYLATGEERWITKPYGKYWSLVANGDKLLALDERGDLYLIRLNPEQFELLDTRKLTENSWAHLAVAGEDVFIRDLAGLMVYRWR